MASLNEESADFYALYYQKLFAGNTLLRSMKRITHKKLEKNLQSSIFQSVLEIGAGNGEHFPFVKHEFDSYNMIDLITPEISGNILDNRITRYQGDFESFDFGASKFDRIIMTCVLHHMNNPAKALSKIKDLMEPGGLFSLFLPCDPGFLNRVNRFAIVNPIAKMIGVPNYPLVNAIEHRNHIWSLHQIVKSTFKDSTISIKYFPSRIRIFDLNTFVIYQIWNRDTN
jgi:phosphatidylethanolamine/phosphatidyl-N-methylethanolamine N-methyltransferase